MKHCFTILLISIFGVAAARGELLLYEGFDYGNSLSNGASLVGATGGSGSAWKGAWEQSSHKTMMQTQQTEWVKGPLSWQATGLTYKDATATLRVAGGSARSSATQADLLMIDRDTTLAVAGTATYWFSLLTQTDGAPGAFLVGQQKGGPLGASLGVTLNVHPNPATGTNFCASLMGTNGPNVAANLKQTYLIVGKISLLADPKLPDRLELWVNPPLNCNEQTIGPAASLAARPFDKLPSQRIAIYSRGKGGIIWDELRVGTTLADVLPTVP